MNWISYNTEGLKSPFLFKFITEKYLFDFLGTGNLWFSRADKFGDKMECVMIKDLIEERPDFDKIERRKRKHFISCFHVGSKETLAFWDTYSQTLDERRKYALRFRREYFVNLIKNNTRRLGIDSNISKLVHGKVRYKNLIGANEEILKKKQVKHIAFRKEFAFAYEKEYRFDIKLKKEVEEVGYNFNIGSSVDIRFDILVNPLLGIEEYKACIKKINEFGYSDKLKESVLAKWLKPDLW